MAGITVVTNPQSRLNRRDLDLASRLRKLAGSKDTVVAPNGLDELAEWARSCVSEPPDILAVCGGDGSLHRVVTAWMQASGGQPPPPVALLRGGTMNTIAKGLGIRGGAESVLSRLVAAQLAGSSLQTVSRRLMVVNEDQYGFLFGNGMISNFLELYYESDNPGPMAAIWVLGRLVVSALVRGDYIRRAMRPFRGEVVVDDVSWGERDWFAVGAGTVDDIGLRFRPFSMCLSHPGHMHALALGNRPLAFLPEFVRIRCAKPLRNPDNQESPATTLRLNSREPIGFMIDGDFHRAGVTLHVRVGPAVEFVVV